MLIDYYKMLIEVKFLYFVLGKFDVGSFMKIICFLGSIRCVKFLNCFIIWSENFCKFLDVLVEGEFVQLDSFSDMVDDFDLRFEILVD